MTFASDNLLVRKIVFNTQIKPLTTSKNKAFW